MAQQPWDKLKMAGQRPESGRLHWKVAVARENLEQNMVVVLDV